jgi:hypothetical protein
LLFNSRVKLFGDGKLRSKWEDHSWSLKSHHMEQLPYKMMKVKLSR